MAKKLIILLNLIFIFRIFALYVMNIDLFFDEAYYWYWSKHLAWGYYSKPPMVAALIWFFTHIFGNNIYAVKIASNLLYTLAAIFVYLSAKELSKNEKLAFISSLAFITLPGISYLSEIISTDAPLCFFWIGSFYFFIKAIKENKALFWILAGLFSGLGLLSKPTMIIFGLSVFLFLIFEKREIFKNRYFYLAILIVFFVYLPNFIWNIHHNFIMFHHIDQISKINNKFYFHLNKLFEFLGGQFLIFGPIFFGYYLIAWKKIKLPQQKILAFFSYPFLILISLQAFLERANINWALPTYLTATILVIWLLWENKRLIYISIGINILLSLLIYFYHPIMHSLNIQLTRKNDFYKRVLGWREVARELNPIYQKNRNFILLFKNRDIMSQMIFYLKPHPLNAQFFNLSKKIVNQFTINTNLNLYKHKNFLFISKDKNINYVEKYFKSCQFVKKINIKVYRDFNRTYYVYKCSDFKGY